MSPGNINNTFCWETEYPGMARYGSGLILIQVRAVITLNPDIIIDSGVGSSSSPYMLKLNNNKE